MQIYYILNPKETKQLIRSMRILIDFIRSFFGEGCFPIGFKSSIKCNHQGVRVRGCLWSSLSFVSVLSNNNYTLLLCGSRVFPDDVEFLFDRIGLAWWFVQIITLIRFWYLYFAEFQAILFVLVRPLSKNAYRRANKEIMELLSLELVWLFDWWANNKVFWKYHIIYTVFLDCILLLKYWVLPFNTQIY